VHSVPVTDPDGGDANRHGTLRAFKSWNFRTRTARVSAADSARR
jgi:hypothetical protein